MKPLGAQVTLEGGIRIVRPSRVEDSIWDAVEKAIDAGWTPEQFKNEVASAWSDRLRDDAKHATKVLSQ